jgi:hypothetical protein
VIRQYVKAVAFYLFELQEAYRKKDQREFERIKAWADKKTAKHFAALSTEELAGLLGSEPQPSADLPEAEDSEHHSIQPQSPTDSQSDPSRQSQLGDCADSKEREPRQYIRSQDQPPQVQETLQSPQHTG